MSRVCAQGDAGLFAGGQSNLETQGLAHCLAPYVGPAARAHYSSTEVGVCGVNWPRELILPLAGENDDDRKNDEPEHEQLRRKRRPELEYAG